MLDMQLDLTANEVAVLADVLDSALRAVREEVYKAEVADYKETLKRRETVLTALLQRMGIPQRTA
jgi:hypothetical protein